MVVRRARLRDGGGTADLATWFERARTGGGRVLLAASGVDGDPLLSGREAGWRVLREAGVVLAPVAAEQVEPTDADAAADALRSALVEALAAAAGAPPLWRAAAERGAAILDSGATGEELSDIAWPHFLLPSGAPPNARRLAAAAATLWLWEGPGAWAGAAADRAHAVLRAPVDGALIAAVAVE
jgi:hypothetical protein